MKARSQFAAVMATLQPLQPEPLPYGLQSHGVTLPDGAGYALPKPEGRRDCSSTVVNRNPVKSMHCTAAVQPTTNWDNGLALLPAEHGLF